MDLWCAGAEPGGEGAGEGISGEAGDLDDAGSCGGERLAVAFDGPGVLCLAADPLVSCQAVGGFCHAGVTFRPGGEAGLVVGFGRAAVGEAAQALRAAGIAFGAAGDHHLMQAALHHGRGEQQRVEAAGALPVDGEPGDALRQARRQGGDARRIAAGAEGV